MAEILQANATHADDVYGIVQETIKAVYPHYYPEGAVSCFSSLHSVEKIASDISKHKLWVLVDDDAGGLFATVTIDANEILRLFVSSQYQGYGHGTRLMDFCEQQIFLRHDRISLAASFPAIGFYLRRGYVFADWHELPCANGDVLCYPEMWLPKPMQSLSEDKNHSPANKKPSIEFINRW
jgi:GNAT superfamily N-acetyltransferase